MAAKVLKSSCEIETARRELNSRGLSELTSLPIRLARQLGLVKGINVGDFLKSWDVKTTVNFLEAHVDRSSPVLDMGTYGSEILCLLHRLGYFSLTGVDLNPEVVLMPYAKHIRYEIADYMHTTFKKDSFVAITAISAIEHGFQSKPLLGEITRLLRPGGYFIASFDYWPDKVDTAGNTHFGMDWLIFSKAEVLSFIEEARKHALIPFGAIHLDAKEPAIKHTGKAYTVAWLALQKQTA